MSRPFRHLQNASTRQLVLALGGGSSVIVGYRLWSHRKPILLDSGHETSDWGAQLPVNSNSLTQRFRNSSKIQAGDIKGREGEEPTEQAPPSQTKGHDADNAAGEASAWSVATSNVYQVCGSISGFDRSSLGARITSFVVPKWLQTLPNVLTKIQNELSMAPWSLSWEIWQEAHDPQINPEILWDAKVRVSEELCREEKDFLQKRKQNTVRALARYLGVAEKDVHPDDVPTIAICGSGGGLRALVAGTSSYLSAHESGLFDCVTYTAGVSGGCWLQTLYYSSIGKLSHQNMIDHLKQRIGVHIAYPPAALDLLSQAPTNKFLLSGFVEKLKGVPDADFGIVDVYGLLLAARLMVPKGELRLSDYDLKISNQRYYTDDGAQPLPIYTAVRHEIPNPPKDMADVPKDSRFTTKHHDWFQWFEWTPYEFFCEELNAGIPTWAMGRRFFDGQNEMRENGMALPELRVPLMLGIWGSAFCATLSHYYREIKPLIRAAGLASLDTTLSQKDQDMVKVHPIDPAVIPNFVLGMRDRLPGTVPETVHDAPILQLMDAGMSNNLPIYPLLRPGRNVDVVIAFDASADVKTDNWIKVVDGYVRQRGIRGWPMGAGWPPAGESSEEITQDMELAKAASIAHTPKTVNEIAGGQTGSMEDLGHCTVWVGTNKPSEEFMDEPPTRRLKHDVSDDYHLTNPEAGVALIYFPFLKNDKVPGVDPKKSDFMSTWNFVYTAEEIDKVVNLARANFDEGKEQTKRTIRAVWQRKKAARLRREKEEREVQRLIRVQSGYAASRRNADVGQGDQFGGV
ncbi:Cytosolic phospholipase A2 zeta [Fulvia fulva]|uniref:Lysophospholipase n=1 Tax=Passalora fulva TaxID=5499 RepID=A0A9Q8P5U5_PASFU|nr:Cytosolic phospholipase A2 zeta [Fulvia fulva]KAK4632336.1 Cytosolic phospholipase A2 zeta [Fulvia fulva]KAK4633577.1 Cytosolic phospholipase A2 zeta [Fulvia fulva]UJO14117.1 Cytosolic phospholipase A2 zeta [Fulvia fulva]WPV11893.1 Cytosolic phospholipase A2 zeta [Fulvia fulva]WPV26128.1 Cytosolic phospholipase A2 zeta [Fulvia fulva]